MTLLHNPTAGDAQHSTEGLAETIRAAGHVVTYRSLKDDGWDRSLQDAGDLVAVAGGDGAVRKVFRKLRGASVPVTVLPLGTANNIAKTLGIPGDAPAGLVRGWTSGSLRPFDVCAAKSPSGKARFVESLGGGIFGEMLVRAERGERSGAEDKIEHGLRLLPDALAQTPATQWSLDLDGDDLSGSYLAVEAMNVRQAGPNVLLAPEADPGDGLLDIVLIREEDREALAAYAEARLRGRSVEPPRFDVRRGRRLVLEAPAELPLHADDHLWPKRGSGNGAGETAVSAGPAQVNVLLPSPA